MSRLRIPALLLICLSLVLSACGGETATSTAVTSSAAPTNTTAAATGSGGEVEITVLTNFTSDVARGKVFDALISDFNGQHSGKIKVVSNTDPDWATLQQKIRSMIAAGAPPDVFLYNYNANDLTREKSGKLMDWTAALNGDATWKDSFRAENLTSVTIDNQVMGIPSDQSPVLFYYRKDLFQKAGITTFPTTWDEFMKDADAIKASGVAPISMMTADDAWHSMNIFSYLGAGAGGADVFAPGASLDSEGVKKAATDLKTMFGYTTADAVGSNYSVSSQNFISGKTAMIIDGPWLISSIQKDVADYCTNVGVATGPTYGDGKASAGFAVTDSLNLWGAAKQSDPAKEAAVVEWMKFLTSQANVKKMSVEGQYPLAVKTTFTDADLSSADCLMGQVLKLNADAPATVVQAQRNITPAAQAQLPSLLESLALGQVTPEEFATQLQGYNK